MNQKSKKAALAAFIIGSMTFISLGIMIAKSGGLIQPAEYPNKQSVLATN